MEYIAALGDCWKEKESICGGLVFMQEMKFVATSGKTTLKNVEVWTLKNDTQFISIWPGDIVRATLYDGTTYEGETVGNIEPWCITVKYMPNESIRFDVNSIVAIEILKYSDLRPNNDKGDFINDISTQEK